MNPSDSISGGAWRAAFAAAGLALALLSGCSPSPLSEAWIEPRPLEGATPLWRPPRLDSRSTESPDGLRAPDAADAELTLREAIALALLYNPDLQAFAWDVRAAEARSIQAGLSPNPMIGYMVENLGGAEVMHTLRLSQVIELGDKRRKRVNVADAEQRLAAWDFEAERLDVVAEVARRYVASNAAQERVALAERTLRLVEQVLDIVEQRVEAGVVPSAERDKATVRVSIERIALEEATHELAASRQALASMWNGTPVFERVVGDLDQRLELPDEESLLMRAASHPRLARWEDELRLREREIELARANGVPDLTAGVGARHFIDADDYAAVVEVGIPLPIVDRNQGRVLEARYALARTRARSAAAEAAIREEITAARADLASAAFAMKTLRDETLPAAQSAFDAATQAFERGRVDFLDVLDAERTLVEVERMLIDAREAYHTSAATLEGLTAHPLD